ncbi:MAG: alkaline phosphatase D family protein [Proteobacteria bacterium]|nr:alkaline phosphatase D family protein [Pseudomonadota bacterium]
MAVSRRDLLATSLALGAAGAFPAILRAAGPGLGGNPFTLGVSSGFPTHDSVVLHTRLALEPLAADGLGGMPAQDVALRWELARDERFRRIARSGETVAAAAQAHSARIEVRGLDPARDYFYRFIAAGEASATGRTRTLPAPHREPREFHLALASCQHLEHGHWAALGHIARAAPDLLVHVGDYIYEGATTANRVRAHVGGNCTTLADYRRRYAQYRMDPALQAAHAASPWMTTWDDHEVANDYSGIHSGRAEDPAAFLKRRAAAYQACFENLPLPPSAQPVNGEVALYTSRRIGTLAEIFMLDQRQYRSAQACPLPGRAGGNRVGEDCADLRNEARTMLGAAQEAWLDAGFARTRARWNLLAQGTVFSHADEQPGEGRRYTTDNWNGYFAARQRVLDGLQRHGVRNPVVLSGDIHSFIAGHIRARPEQPDSPLLATEIVATSVSSDGRPPQQLDDWLRENPDLLLAEGRYRGHVALRLSPRRLQASLMALENRDDPQSPQRVLQTLVVEAGRPQLQRG